MVASSSSSTARYYRTYRTDLRFLIKHALLCSKGVATVEVLLYGATVISWQSSPPDSTEQKEHLFVSSKAALDGSKPVRGGIPIVFPCFGQPTLEAHKGLPQHGYARNSKWAYSGTPRLDNDDGVVVELSE